MIEREDPVAELAKGAAGVVLVIALIIPFVGVTAFVQGLCFTYLWSWFVCPVFGCREIGIAEAAGLAVIVGFFRAYKKSTDWKSEWAALFAGPLLSLGFGWVLHHFFL